MSITAAERFTRKLALSHYENFIVGGLLTPRRLRQDFYNIYAYCRMADDIADEISDDQESLRQLDQWQRWLNECYEDRTPAHPPPHPVFEALRTTIAKFQIPPQPFLQLLDAFRQDQTKKCYRTMDEVVDYSSRSANPVGHLVLYMGESHTTRNVHLADQICTGLQLANFWQDVRRDATINRIYVPTESLSQFGIAAEALNQDHPPAGGRELIRDLVEQTAVFFDRGMPLIETVPNWLSKNVRLFVGGGRATLKAIEDVDYDVWTRRPKVSRLQQLRLVAKNLW